MSGHSKWANIKRKKEANDKVKGSVFSKLSRLITLSVIEGGGIGDPEHNFKLRLIIEKARVANMPKENIKRAIDKASGANSNLLKEVVYEAFAPNKILLIILATSDNINRTLSSIRNGLEMYGGKLGDKGSTAYMFNKCGLVSFSKSQVNEDDIFKFAERIEALEIDQDATSFFVYLPFDSLGKVKNALENLVYEEAEVDFKPLTTISISDRNIAKKTLQLIESLEALDDVHKVFANFDIDDKIMQEFEASK